MEAQGVKILELNASKAGLQGVDKDRVNKIIQEASKGTPYYEHQQKRQRRINLRIDAMLGELKNLTSAQLQSSQHQMDIIAERMEHSRDLNRIIVHVDMDAFYAAVEMLDDPSLRDKPMAVGSMGMLVLARRIVPGRATFDLEQPQKKEKEKKNAQSPAANAFVPHSSTSNYEARKFGVRAAMPGFIGKKLCPSLVIVRPNFDKYTAYSRKVRQVLALYDEDFTPVGLDEAYLDITEYMAKNEIEAEDVVQEIRQKIFDTTQLTASAGIAANMFLAKVCSDIRKPNDQFRLPNDVDSIRKYAAHGHEGKQGYWIAFHSFVPGIGAVQEQLLVALGVRTCHDLWDKRGEIGHLFGEVTARFYLRAALGLGCTEVKCDSSRKSKSVEETFAEISNPQELVSKCEELCEELHQQIQEEGICGRVVTVKMKTVMFDVMTRSMTLDSATDKLETIKQAALRLLHQEIAAAKSGQPLRLRLMGVRLSGFDESTSISSSQPTLSAFLSSKKAAQCPVCQKTLENSSPDFVNAHVDACLDEQRQNKQQQQDSPECAQFELNCTGSVDTSGTFDELLLHSSPEASRHASEDEGTKHSAAVNSSVPAGSFKEQAAGSEEEPTSVGCPVCGHVIRETDWSRVNEHIDTCLNKPMIREMLSSQEFTCSPVSEKRMAETPKSRRSQKRLKSSQQPRQQNSITNYLSPSSSKA